MNALTRRIVNYRQQYGLSLRALARLSGVSHETLRRASHGLPIVGLRAIAQIGRTVGLAAEEIDQLVASTAIQRITDRRRGRRGSRERR